MSDLEFRTVKRAAQPFVGVTAAVTMDHFAPVADTLPVTLARLAEAGVGTVGAPFFRYLVIDMERELVVQGGVGVQSLDAVAAAGLDDLETGVLPAGRYVTTTAVGHPDRLVEVTGRLLAWADQQGLVLAHHDTPQGDAWECRLELCESDPREVEMDQWVTTLAFLLAD